MFTVLTYGNSCSIAFGPEQRYSGCEFRRLSGCWCNIGVNRLSRRVHNAMRNMARGNVGTRRAAVPLLVVEEDVGAKGFEESGFVEAAEEHGLVDADIPCP